MIKLKPLYNEIKIVENITPEMVLQKFSTIYEPSEGWRNKPEPYRLSFYKILDKYGFPDGIFTDENKRRRYVFSLDKNTLKNIYYDFNNIK